MKLINRRRHPFLVLVFAAIAIGMLSTQPVAADEASDAAASCASRYRVLFLPKARPSSASPSVLNVDQPTVSIYRGTGRRYRSKDLVIRVTALPAGDPTVPPFDLDCPVPQATHRRKQMIEKTEVHKAVQLLCTFDEREHEISSGVLGGANSLYLKGARRNVMYAIMKPDGPYLKYDATVCRAAKVPD